MKTFIAFFLLLTCIRCAIAADATARWDRSPSEGVAGYLIYYGTSTLVYPQSHDAGDAETTIITGLTPGVTYYFVVVAYAADDGLHSPPSNEVAYTVPMPVPISLTHDAASKSLRWTDPDAPPLPQLDTYLVQHASGAGPWETAANVQGSDYPLPSGLAAGEHRYRVARLDSEATGEWSNVITLTVPEPPRNLRIALQISYDLKTWTPVAEHDPGDVQRVFARAIFVQP